MIVLDTHAWIWWVHSPEKLTASQLAAVTDSETDVIGVSAISCWEIAKLVQYGRLELPVTLDTWFEQALSYPGLRLLALTPRIAVASTRLPGDFHRDPADQLIMDGTCVLVPSGHPRHAHPELPACEDDSLGGALAADDRRRIHH